MSGVGEASGRRREVSKRRLKSPGIDRFSVLPEALIVHILSFLSIRDKIRTGALSRRWKDMWTLVPKLHFNWDYDIDAEDESLTVGDFVKRVNKTLILILSCGTKICDFGVNFPYEDAFSSDVDVWTRFAARNQTQKFELDFEPAEEGDAQVYALPEHLYKNPFFKELRFHCCKFIINGTVSWSSLKKLTISQGTFGDEEIGKLVAGAPALEFLDLSFFDCAGISKLHFGNSNLKKLILYIEDYVLEESLYEILAPSVQSLKVSGRFQTFKLVDMTSLVEASLFGRHHRLRGQYPILTQEVANSLLNVHTLTVGTWVIQGIAMLPTNNGRPWFPKCKCLTVDTHLWKEDPSAIASLLESAPEVETLIVTMSEYDSIVKFFQDSPSEHGNSNIDQYWTSQEMGCKYLTRLRTVKFIGIWAYRSVMFAFVQFLLKNATGLQKAIFCMDTEDISHKIAPTELCETSQKLFSFHRSSPDATLVICQGNGY